MIPGTSGAKAKQLTMMAIRALSMTVGTPSMNRMKNDTGSSQ